MIRLFLIVVLLVGIVSCSVRYGPRIPGIQPGYEEERLGEDTHQVRIGEAWPKDWPDVEKFALYRAAEVTLASGRRYFAVLSSSSRINSYVAATPKITTTTGTAAISGNTISGSSVSTTSGGSTHAIEGGWYIMDFKTLESSNGAGYSTIIDANKVIEDLKYFIAKRS